MPPELSPEMLLLVQVPLDSWAPAPVSWRYDRNVVVAATPITALLEAGEPTVPVTPASPVLATTVTPAATALASARLIGSVLVSGYGLPPNDSFSTSAPEATA